MLNTMTDKTFEISYDGDLRCTAVHLKSGSTLNTDAPTDNNGKGERFSPTDLVATGLTTCILTILGIRMEKAGRQLSDIHCDVKKVMASNPRRIAEVKIDFDFGDNDFSEKDLLLIKELVHHCPVSESLHPDIQISTNL